MKKLTATQHHHYLLKHLLKIMVSKKPNDKYIHIMSSLLSNSALEYPIVVSQNLTEREMNCLLLAAKGMTSSETATCLGIKASTVETYRRKIKAKLSCATMAQAVFEGVRIGHITRKLTAK